MIPPSPVNKSDNPIIRILIVDDMPQVRQELHMLLQLTNGLDVVGEAGNGKEAVQQSELLHPDVVIMDLEMPIMDGLQATQEIKRRRLAKRVVILSVHSKPEDLLNARQAGADDFIQKGAPYTTLIQTLKVYNQ